MIGARVMIILNDYGPHISPAELLDFIIDV